MAITARQAELDKTYAGAAVAIFINRVQHPVGKVTKREHARAQPERRSLMLLPDQDRPDVGLGVVHARCQFAYSLVIATCTRSSARCQSWQSR